MTWKPTPAPFGKFKKEEFIKAAKVTSFTYQIGEFPALRQPSADIPINKITSKEMKKKFEYLKKCLLKYRKLSGYGRGMAAVQVGIPERFAVIYTTEKLLLIINPKILQSSAKLLRRPEMCMSANPVIAPVTRPAWIEFEYYDEEANKHVWNTKDDTDQGRILNRVFEHEIDHLDGVINIDRVQSKDLILYSDPHYFDNVTFEEVNE